MPYLPWDDEFVMLPDLVVADIGYCYTGLRDSRGHKILRRVSRKIGFVHHGPAVEYVTEPDDDAGEPQDRVDPYEGEDE